MKINIKIDKDKIGYFSVMIIIFAFLGILARYCDLKKEPKIRKNIEELYVNGQFAIGIIIAITADVPGYHTTVGTIFYKFESSTSIIYANFGAAQPKQISANTDSLFKKRLSAGIKLEDLFLVLYDKNDPKNAILLLDHPIKSDADFERYKAEIEELRKDPKWHGYE